MKIPSKGMVKYATAAKAKADGGAKMTTLALGEEGGTKPGGGGGRVTTQAVGEEGGRATTEAVGEEGGTRPGGGGRVTTQAVGEEGGGATTMALGEEGGTRPGGGGGQATTMAVGEEGGFTRPDVTTAAIGEEGGGSKSTFTAKVTTLLSDKKINNEANDYKAYGRPGPGGGPAHLFGQQFKFGKAEAVKLSKTITTSYEPAAQKKILKEIHMRSTTNMTPKGTVALTRDAAVELNKLSKKLGLDLLFTFNQPRPIHPVG